MKHIIIILLFFAACSPAKRIERICAKNPQVCEMRDTSIILRDTVILRPRVLADTVTIRDKDTVIIEKDRIITRIIRDVDTFEVETTCPGDTIIRVDTVTVQTGITVTDTKREKWWHVPLIAVLGGLLFVAVGKMVLGD